MFFRDGSVYDGEFLGDKVHGHGRLMEPNGRVREEYFEAVNPDSL